MGFMVFTTGTIGFIFSYKLNIKKNRPYGHSHPMPYVLLVWAELAVGIFDMLKSSFVKDESHINIH